MKSPYPYFGGKARVAPMVWARFGGARNYVEPFLGSAAMLLARPGGAQGVETVNDACGYVANFWRALQAEPEQVAAWADQPVNENDLHARHHWLRARDMRARLEGDPYWYDAQAAGWWVWGMACWIGTGWCGPQGAGPWVVRDGELVRGEDGGGGEAGVTRQVVHLGDAGRGVTRQVVHQGGVLEYMQQLRDRMRRVRVACGDWSRVCGSSATWRHGTTAVFLDPPYCSEDRQDCYAQESYTVAHDVRSWCAEMGQRQDMRIALCGYEGEHDALEDLGWEVVSWKASGGYGSQGDLSGRANSRRERIWFSPACVRPDVQSALWEDAT